ncbi:MAG: hypothetical protein RLY80_678 [Actinomycetota bacterium]
MSLNVTREFYINDRGVQMDLFGESVRAAALGNPIPEDGYQGDYISDIAKHLVRTCLRMATCRSKKSSRNF